MESIKNKMEALVHEKEEATKLAEELETDRDLLTAQAKKQGKSIEEAEKEISKLEIDYDDNATRYQTATEKLTEVNKDVSAAELEVSALIRRVQLLEEESSRVNERLEEVVEKVQIVEKHAEDHERTRKVLEAKSFANEEKSELNEAQLVEAIILAEEASRKQDDVERKLRMVETDLERISDKAEEFEGKASEYEAKMEMDRTLLKTLEEDATKNGEKEDHLDNEVVRLSEELKNMETRAEFSERTVEKLEQQVDTITDSLYQEKVAFNEMSKKLDQTLNDMMNI